MRCIACFLLGFVVSGLYVNYGEVKAVCNDGYLSKSEGRGTCSYHGGVKYYVKDVVLNRLVWSEYGKD